MSARRHAWLRALRCLALWIGTWHAALGVHAQPSQAPNLTLEAEGCAAELASEVTRLLQLELGPRASSAANGAPHTELRCEQDVALLKVSDACSGDKGERLDLKATPAELRARVIALQSAELVRGLDLTRAQRCTPPSVASAQPTAVEPVRERRRTFHLGAFAQLNSFSRDGRWIAGAGARFSYDVSALTLQLDAALAGRTFSPQLGEVELLWGYAAPQLAWLVRWRALRFTLGAGYALGAARVRGATTRTDAGSAEVSGFWAAPFGALELGYAPLRFLLISAGASLGWVQAGVTGEIEQASDVRLSGMWTQLRVGLAVGF